MNAYPHFFDKFFSTNIGYFGRMAAEVSYLNYGGEGGEFKGEGK